MRKKRSPLSIPLNIANGDPSNMLLRHTQITAVFQAVGSCIMTVIDGIGAALQGIMSGVVTVCDIVVSCLTCGYVGRRRYGLAARYRHRYRSGPVM